MTKKKTRPRGQSEQEPIGAPSSDGGPSHSGICRDFLRNVCTRENCKFEHEPVSVQFCHDFQNTRHCPRKHCKYTHGTYEDEQSYLTSGKLPDHLRPVCLNYLKKQCTRSKCKFLHPPVAEPDGNVDLMCLGQTPSRVKATHDHVEPEESLTQENEFLKMRLHQLESHLTELRSSNEFLMEENHRLRQERHHTTSLTTLSTLAVPHSGSNVVTALAVPNSTNMTLAVPHSATSVAALAVPHSATSVAALAVPHSATSVAALTVPAVTINTKQQVVSGATLVPVSLATMTTATPVSIATVTPVSIATVTTGAPVSIATVSMPAPDHQTSVIYPILTQVCSKMN